VQRPEAGLKMEQDIAAFSWDNFFIWITGFAFLAILIERSLYQMFTLKLWKNLEDMIDKAVGGDYLDLKPIISALVAIYLVFTFDLDMIAFMFQKPTYRFSKVLTGLFLAGGSKGVYKFLKRAREIRDLTYQQKISKTNIENNEG